MKCLTWNVSWEAMTGSDTSVRGSVCGQSGKICIENVVGVLAQCMAAQQDFLCLQENVLGNLAMNGYQQVDAKDGLETISTLYHPKYRLVSSFSGALQSGRPYLVCIFDSIVVINVHAGHRGNGLLIFGVLEKELPRELIRLIQMRPIVFVGDFNVRMTDAFCFGKLMRVSPDLITCCDKGLGLENLSKYTRMQDQFMISPTLRFDSVRTLLNQDDNVQQSDHLPVEAVIGSLAS